MQIIDAQLMRSQKHSFSGHLGWEYDHSMSEVARRTHSKLKHLFTIRTVSSTYIHEAPIFDQDTAVGQIVPFAHPISTSSDVVPPERAILDLAEAARRFSQALETFEERVHAHPNAEAQRLMIKAWKRLAAGLGVDLPHS